MSLESVLGDSKISKTPYQQRQLAAIRKSRVEDPEKWKEYRRRAQLKFRYNITPEQYAEMLCQQKGVCAVCERDCVTGKRLAVDHNHETGKVRGLLCQICNHELGHFEKFYKSLPDLNTLTEYGQKMAVYLEAHKCH